MTRNEEYQALLQELEPTPPALEGTAERALRRRRRDRRLRLFGVPAGSLAACFAAFVLLVNLSVPFARACGSVPLLRELALAVAFSHHAKLLVLDEATSGLDPVVRDDILDLFLEFVQEEDHAILVSSHITSDLEKVADYIVFLHQGRVVFCKPKDELRYRYGVLRCGQAQFADLDPADMVACRRQDYEWEVLVADRDAARRKYPKAVVDPDTMDEIMLLYVKGERR